MATKYNVIFADGSAALRARKDAAIKLGEAQAQPFQVVTVPGGVVVHTSPTEAPAPADTEKENTVAKKTTEKPALAAVPDPEPAAEEREGWELEFQGLGKYYAKAAGLHGAEVVGAVYGVEASLKGTTLTLYGAAEDVDTVIEKLVPLWSAAKEAHRVYRKNDATYSGIDKSRKNPEANAQRWDLEVKWFTEFMNGAADALAGKAKRKTGAYRDGVNAAENPTEAPAASDLDDVL